MLNEKHGRWQVKITNGKFGMFFMFMPQLGNKIRIIRRCNRTPLIQQIKNTQLLIINKFQ